MPYFYQLWPVTNLCKCIVASTIFDPATAYMIRKQHGLMSEAATLITLIKYGIDI